jgi:hypothetical protein
VADSKQPLPKPKLKNHPVDVGLRSETAILAALVKRGYTVLLPWNVNCRYDLVIDLGDRLLRAQCKTGRLRNGAVEFATRSTRANRRGCFTRNYVGEIDLFLVYCPQNTGVYVVPADAAPQSGMTLRIDTTLNGQSQHVNWAADYELPG